MDCTEYRRSALVDPQGASAELRPHLETCAECAQFTERLLRFEATLVRAMRVDVAVRGDNVVPLRAAKSSSGLGPLAPGQRWLALAASVILGIGVAGGLWLAIPGRSLAADVVKHMAGEPNAWARSERAVADADLRKVLRDSHLRLRYGGGIVSYASSCVFRGHQVPHLVVQSANGPVTVMVLTRESVPKAQQFNEQGYRGVILPVTGHGSLAVLTRGPAAGAAMVEKIAANLLGSIVWTS